MAKAPEWIAEEIEQSQGAARALCLDARRGLAPPRAIESIGQGRVVPGGYSYPSVKKSVSSSALA